MIRGGACAAGQGRGWGGAPKRALPRRGHNARTRGGGRHGLPTAASRRAQRGHSRLAGRVLQAQRPRARRPNCRRPARGGTGAIAPDEPSRRVKARAANPPATTRRGVPAPALVVLVAGRGAPGLARPSPWSADRAVRCTLGRPSLNQPLSRSRPTQPEHTITTLSCTHASRDNVA